MEVVELKLCIMNMIKDLNENNFLLEKDLMSFVDTCYILNYSLNSGFLDEILHDIKLKYNENYDILYIFRNIDKIKTFIDVI